MQGYRELVILIVEDDDGHAELIREGLMDAGLCNRILRFADGEAAWNFLSGSGDGAQMESTVRYLLLLDINMPKMDGVEVLQRVKADPRLKEMPVIMLTTTDDPREVEECYRLGCNIYITKPVDFAVFAESLKRLGLFLQVVTV